jgi:hypothetical protein
MIDQLEMFATGATPFSVRTVKRDQDVHANSVKVYREDTAKISKRASEVLRLLKVSGVALTDREVMKSLGFTDPNSVRPRITELIDAGLIKEAGTTTDELTGKKVRRVTA